MKLKHYMEHIRECHAYSPAFAITCGLNGCPRTFKNFLSFRTHVYEWHGGDPNISNDSTVALDTPEQDIAEDVSSDLTVALDTPEQEQDVTEEVASVAGDASNVDRNEAAIYHNDAGIVHMIKC